ncbi:MAG: sensor histidine kinase [Candidatus Dormibacteria bacterium]
MTERPRGFLDWRSRRSDPAVVQRVGPDWAAPALAASPVPWVVVDQRLQVTEASPAALGLFTVAPPLPAALVAFTRSPEVESRARELLAGAVGPWQVAVPHFAKQLRMSGLQLTGGRAVLFWEDLTELRRLESVRTEFVANLAHELRTPITSLRLAVETLALGVPPEEAPVFLGRLIQEADYIAGVLDTLSELARLEEGAVKLNPETFALAPVIDETWRRVEGDASTVRLSNTVDSGATLAADRPKIGQVLQNLLQNAHRYSPADGTVSAGSVRAGAEVQIWVEDQGPGIPPADLPRIFERFFKSEASRTRGDRGSGLGLAIAKHLVSAHGGRIWAEAGATGGTRVTFTLPQVESLTPNRNL